MQIHTETGGRVKARVADKAKKPSPKTLMRQRRVAALGGQDPLLKEAVSVLQLAVKREGRTWQWISSKSKRDGGQTATSTMANWRNGVTRSSLMSTMNRTLRAVGKRLYIGDA